MVSRFSRHLLCLWLACWAVPQSVAQERATTSTNIGDWLRLLDATAHRLIAIRPGRDTTRITEPRTNDGYIDYAEALNRLASQGVNRNDNAACLLWRVVERGEVDCPPGYFESRWFRMSAPPADKPIRPFVTYQSYGRRKYEAANQNITGERWERLFTHFDLALEQGVWQAADFPLLAEWLEEIKEPLAIITEASRKPRFFSPICREHITAEGKLTMPSQLPHSGPGVTWFRDPLDMIRLALPAFRLRAALLIGQGKGKEAWEDIATCHRLARLWLQSPILPMYMLGCQAEIYANEALFLLASSSVLGEDEWKVIQGQRRQIGPWQTPARQLDMGTRLATLDLMQEVPRHRYPPFAYFIGTGRGLEPASTPLEMAYLEASLLWLTDWNLVAKMINNRFDEWVQALRLQDDAARLDRLASLSENYWKWETESWDSSLLLAIKWVSLRKPHPLERLMMRRLTNAHSLAGMAFSTGTGAPFSAALETAFRRVARYAGLGDLAIAIAIHKARHGTYPRTLDTLAPSILKQIPTDLLAQTTYRYRLTPTGCVVYTVGANPGNRDGEFAESDVDHHNLDGIAVQFGENNKR